MDATTSAQIFSLTTQLLSTTSDNYIGLTTSIYFIVGALITIALGVVGANVLWNFYFSGKKIEAEIETKHDSLSNEIEKKFADKTTEIEKRITDSMDALIEKKFSSLQRKLTLMEAEHERLCAISSTNGNHYPNALDWWFGALEKYLDLKSDFLIGVCVREIVKIFNKDDLADNNTEELKELDWDDFKRIISKVPDLVSEDKKAILKGIKVGKALVNSEK